MPRSRSSDTFKARKDLVAVVDTDPFIQTFEKPTQIYRYLKTRFIASPLFLHRNLSYMKGRCNRNHKRRASFKVNEILESVKERREKEKDRDAFDKLSSENLLIAFICFNDEFLNTKNVKIETKLEKISHKRRKEGTLGQNQIRIGESIVTVNTDENGTEMLPAVCVSNTEFDRLGESFQTTYQLTFDIESLAPLAGLTPKKEKDADEPPAKAQCIRKQYHAELPVFDKVGRNLLVNGLYHVTALESHAFRQSRMPCWENLTSEVQHIADWAEEVNKYYFAEDDSNPFMTFDKTPKIQLYMEWTRSKIAGNNYIQRPKFISDQHNNNGNKENNSTINIPTTNGLNGQHTNGVVSTTDPSLKRFIFQFVVNSNTKQRTEERTDFICPWCSLNCLRIYSLMKHLKLSHARLLFQYIEEGSKGRIDVYVNELYDGSYSGAPHDVLLGSQRGPTRRNVVTNIMVFRPRRPTFKMCEFLEADDGELDQQRQYISGHNRIYYHSETCIPIMPKELDYDSEGEPDPKWLQRTTKQMIDEFTDVNGGEKELMKLWNLHVMKHVFVGDCQISLACDLFLAEKGKELLEKKLFRNYVVHLNSLFNYGLISPRNIDRNIQKLIKMQKEHTDAEVLQEERKVQIKHWRLDNGKDETTKKLDLPTTPSKPSTFKQASKNTKSDTKSTAKALPKHGENGLSPAATKNKGNLKRKMSS